GDAYKLRVSEHRDPPNSKRPRGNYVAIPRHAAAQGHYGHVQYNRPDGVCGDANFMASDPEGPDVGYICAAIFMSWQRAIGGRIKSDLRFASTVTWNTFPVPLLGEEPRERIIKAGKKILAVRELHPERSLRDHYNPLAMDPALLKAHSNLDREVDKAFGASKKLTTEAQRLELLFKNYQDLTQDEEKK